MKFLLRYQEFACEPLVAGNLALRLQTMPNVTIFGAMVYYDNNIIMTVAYYGSGYIIVNMVRLKTWILK